MIVPFIITFLFFNTLYYLTTLIYFPNTFSFNFSLYLPINLNINKISFFNFMNVHLTFLFLLINYIFFISTIFLYLLKYLGIIGLYSFILLVILLGFTFIVKV
jgi:hypothetical protein